MNDNLTSAQKLALEFRKLCTDHTYKEVQEAIEIFQWELPRLAVVTCDQETSEAPVPHQSY